MIKQVKIGAQVWKVRETGDLNDEHGTCDPITQTILIDKALCKDQKECVLLHEVIHACCRFAALDPEKEYTEEQFISRIEPVLYSVLKQNKLF